MSPTDAIHEVIFGLIEEAHEVASDAQKSNRSELHRADKLQQLGEDIAAVAVALKIAVRARS